MEYPPPNPASRLDLPPPAKDLGLTDDSLKIADEDELKINGLHDTLVTLPLAAQEQPTISQADHFDALRPNNSADHTPEIKLTRRDQAAAIIGSFVGKNFFRVRQYRPFDVDNKINRTENKINRLLVGDATTRAAAIAMKTNPDEFVEKTKNTGDFFYRLGNAHSQVAAAKLSELAYPKEKKPVFIANNRKQSKTSRTVSESVHKRDDLGRILSLGVGALEKRLIPELTVINNAVASGESAVDALSLKDANKRLKSEGYGRRQRKDMIGELKRVSRVADDYTLTANKVDLFYQGRNPNHGLKYKRLVRKLDKLEKKRQKKLDKKD